MRVNQILFAIFFIFGSQVAFAQTQNWVRCASENQTCLFAGTKDVRYGAGEQFVIRKFTNRVRCSNSKFGDPAYGVVKSCYYASDSAPAPTPTPEPTPTPTPTPVSSWVDCASENQTCSFSGTRDVRYGAGTQFIILNFTDGVSCSNSIFGDPVYGVAKSCSYSTNTTTPAPTPTPTPAPTPTPTPAPTPVVLAPSIQYFNASSSSIRLGQSVTLSWETTGATSLDLSNIGNVTGFNSQTVSPIVDTNYILTARNSAGSVTANRAVAVTAATTTQPVGTGPTIDVSQIPQGSSGSGARLIRNTGEMPDSSDIGAFRTVCAYSHMNFDDAIVFPNQPGRSHLHTYFGNTSASGNSTSESIANSGNSTCRGGIVNRSAYWVPSLIDTRNGRPIAPELAHIYYKTGYNGVQAEVIRPFPQGFKMIAGSANASSAQEYVSWVCNTTAGYTSPSIRGDCAPGSDLEMLVSFPQCWNGRDLDSADHKSHMARAQNGCPASHPVALPEITITVVYKVPATGSSTLRLSSDTYSSSLPGGISVHADFMHGWEQEVMDTFVSRVINLRRDAGSHIIGDGRVIYGER